MESKIKILVAGDVRGRFRQLFQRVDTINKKSGPFDILLCVGEFFDESNNDELIAYKNGNKLIAVPTYILGPNIPGTVEHYKSIADGEICSNLTYLGKRGLYTLSSGVKIVYLSGIELPSEKTENKQSLHYFTKEDITAIRSLCLAHKSSASDYKGVDILLTSQWPHGVSQQNTSKLIAFLAKEIKPRYHFCGLNGKYFEPPPFRIPADHITQLQLCTRFIGLGDVGNSSKEKYIYALSLTPVEKTRVMDLIQRTTNETDCPYEGIDFKVFQSGDQSFENTQYFFDMQSGQSWQQGKRRSGGDNHPNKRQRIMHIDQEKCWFCLSSPDVEKHLVISIGDRFYLALARGPINDYHVLIMSITHIPAAALLSEEDWVELTKFKEALRKFFKDEGQVVCFTERHYKSSHVHLNALGIDAGFSWKIAHVFEDKAEEYNIQFETLPPLTSPQMLPQQGPYFVAELPNETTLITRQMRHFPLHFARDVYCSENMLNCEEKVNWRDCLLDKEGELKMVESFRKKFSKYDFTIS